MTNIIISGFNWLFVVTGIIGIIGVVLLLPGVVIGAVLVAKEKDETKKKSIIKKGIMLAILPFILIITGLIGTVIIQVIKTLIK